MLPVLSLSCLLYTSIYVSQGNVFIWQYVKANISVWKHAMFKSISFILMAIVEMIVRFVATIFYLFKYRYYNIFPVGKYAK